MHLSLMLVKTEVLPATSGHRWCYSFEMLISTLFVSTLLQYFSLSLSRDPAYSPLSHSFITWCCVHTSPFYLYTRQVYLTIFHTHSSIKFWISTHHVTKISLIQMITWSAHLGDYFLKITLSLLFSRHHHLLTIHLIHLISLLSLLFLISRNQLLSQCSHLYHKVSSL